MVKSCPLQLLRFRHSCVRLVFHRTTAGPILAAEGPAPAMLADAAYSLAELDWLIRHERVRHLADLVMRRTAIAVTGRLTGRDLDRIAGLCARALDWDDTRRRQEIADTRAMLTGRHRLRMDQAASE